MMVSHDIGRLCRRDPVLASAVVITAACTALTAFFSDGPGNDVAAYYAPLAHEFGAGRYGFAFLHLAPPLVPVLAGLLAKVGLPAFTALRLVSMLFHAAGLLPLHSLLRRTLPPNRVAWGCLLYAVCPRLLRYATAGGLDGAKTFFLLLLVAQCLAYAETTRRRHVVGIAAAMAGLSLSRGEGSLFIPFGVLVVFGASLANSGPVKTRMTKALSGCVPAVLLCLVLCSPWIWYQCRVTGYPVLDSRQAWFVKTVAARIRSAPPPPPLSRGPEGARLLPQERHEDEPSALRSLREALKGLVPAYLALAAVGLLSQAFSGGFAWSGFDTVCLSVVLYNAGLFAATGFITKRYTSPTVPFLLPWCVEGATVLASLGHRIGMWPPDTALRRIGPLVAVLACGILWPWDRARVRVGLSAAVLFCGVMGLSVTARRRIGVCLAILFCAGALFDGTSEIRPSWPPQPDPAEGVGRWISENGNELDLQPGSPIDSPVANDEYHNGRQPVVAAYRPQHAYWAHGDWVKVSSNHEFPYTALVRLCTEKSVDVLVTGERFARICPEFDAQNRHFRPVSDRWSDRQIRVYAFVPQGTLQ